MRCQIYFNGVRGAAEFSIWISLLASASDWIREKVFFHIFSFCGNKERFLSPEFKELWDREKYKTTFHVDFDPDALVKACAEALADESKLVVIYPKYIFGRGKVDVTKAGVFVTEPTGKSEPFSFDDFEYPAVISYLQNETNLTRKSIAQILIDSGRIEDFKINPQMFIDGSIAIIKNVMSKFVVDGIKYHKLGNDDIWAQELFEK